MRVGGGRGGGGLAGEQLGGLEHNYKVNDLSGVAMTPSWYPMSFLSKPLNYSSISSDFSVFCPSPKVLQTALYVVCWLRTSVLSSHFYFPYLLCSSVGKLLSHQPQVSSSNYRRFLKKKWSLYLKSIHYSCRLSAGSAQNTGDMRTDPKLHEVDSFGCHTKSYVYCVLPLMRPWLWWSKCS